MATYGAYLALFVAVSVGAVPTQYGVSDLDTCAQTCSGETTKFQYKPGTSYRYRYEVNTETSQASVTEELAKIFIETTAEIEAGDNCDFVLRLRDTNIFQSVPYKDNMLISPREEEFKTALEQNALRFSFDNGVVSNVCPSASEEPRPLNFKKGLLSVFQNSMDDFEQTSKIVTEVDITGECETQYTLNRPWGWGSDIQISKTKALPGCTHRAGYKNLATLVPYFVPSEIQNVPLLESSHKCEHAIGSDRILNTATCTELHAFRPFSRRESGARTSVTQKLTYQNKALRSSGSPAPMAKRESLLYSHEEKPREATKQNAEQILKELCDQTKLDIRPETPRLFHELSEVVAGLQTEDLDILYKQLKSDIICPNHDKALRFFMNTLPNTKTQSTINMMVKIINEDELEDFHAKLWIQSLSYVKEASEAAVQAVESLLDGKFSEVAKLPVSTVVSSYCNKNPDCQSNINVQKVMSKLAASIGSSCSVDDSNNVPVLNSLRALGNVKHLTKKDPLITCLTSESSPVEVKVSAADGYRRAACPGPNEKDEALWSVMKDSKADMEVRVSSYLSIMRCPEQSTLEEIASYLNTVEDSDPMGPFIYSHLKNIKESSDPFKQEVAERISNLNLRLFDISGIAQSRNMEASFLLHKMNLGATVDTNIIMDPKMPVPRAGRVNVTMDLFGNSINLLDIGVRVEGIETQLPKILGFSPPKDGEEPHASVYGRMFGNEIGYMYDFDGDDPFGLLGLLPTRREMFKKFPKKKTKEYTFSNNFLDTTVTFPTAAGLPLEIKANGTSNIDLLLEAKFLRLKEPRWSQEIETAFNFGAALEISGEMTVDALGTRQGVRMRNTMHSSTGARVRVDLDRLKLLSVEIDAPRDNMEIFQAKAEFFMNHDGVEKLQDVAKDLSTLTLCTSEKAAVITGAQLCTELGHTNVAVILRKKDTQTSYKFMTQFLPEDTIQFQLNTPGSATDRFISLTLGIGSKPNPHLEIELISPWKKFESRSDFTVKDRILSINSKSVIDDTEHYATMIEVHRSRNRAERSVTYTPFVEVTRDGKKTKHVSGEITFSRDDGMEYEFEVTDIYGETRTIKGQLMLRRHVKVFKYEVIKEGRELVKVSLGGTRTLTRGEKGSQYWDYEPEFIWRTHRQHYFDVGGKIHYGYKKPNMTISGKITAKLLDEKPTEVQWENSFTKEKGKMSRELSLKVKSKYINGNIDATGHIYNNHLVTGRVKAYYNIPGVSKNSFVYTSKINNLSKGALNKYSWKSSLTNKKFPVYNTAVDVNIESKRKLSAGDIEIRYGENHNLKHKRINLSASLKRDIKDSQHADVTVNLAASIPERKVDTDIEIKHHHTPTVLDTKVKAKLRPLTDKHVEAGINYHDKSTSKLKHIDGEIYAQRGNKKMSLSSKFNQKSHDHYVHVVSAKTLAGRTYGVSTDVKTHEKTKKHEVKTSITMPGYKAIQLKGKAHLIPTNALINGNVVYGTDNYGASLVHKRSEGHFAKWRFEVEHPDRKVELHLNGKEGLNRLDIDYHLNWDARRKERSRSEIKINGNFEFQDTESSTVSTSNLHLKTPFDPVKDVAATVKYVNDQDQHNLFTKLNWDGKSGKIASNLLVKKPLTPYNVKINLNTHTSFKHYKHMELDIDHTLDENLLTKLKRKVNDEMVEVRVKGANKGTLEQRDISGYVDLKTPYKNLRRLTLSAEHTSEGKNYETKAKMNRDGTKYQATIKADVESMLKHSGTLNVKRPDGDLDASWNHLVVPKVSVDTTLLAEWDKDKKLDVLLTSKLEETETGGKRTVMEFDVKSPFPEYRYYNAKSEYELSRQKVDMKGSIFRNRQQQFVYRIFGDVTEDTRTADLYLKASPESNEIKYESSTYFGGFPMTHNVLFEWNPESKITFDGSVDTPSWDNAEITGKLTTPFETLKSINVVGSSKIENEEYVTRANLEYGPGKIIDFERRLRDDDEMKLARYRLETPFESLTKLGVGVQIEPKTGGVDAKADIQMLPTFDKHEIFYAVKISDEDGTGVYGKLQVNTPTAEPFLKITSRSNNNADKSRSSHIEIVHSDNGVFSLGSTFRFENPYKLEVEVETPNPDFTNVGFKIDSDLGENTLDWKGLVVYKPDKQVKLTIEGDITKGIDLNVVVNTPIEGFEHNYLTLQRGSTPTSLTSDVNIKVGKYKLIHSGTLTWSAKHSSFNVNYVVESPGMEDVSITIKGEATLSEDKGMEYVETTVDMQRGDKTVNGKYTARADTRNDVEMAWSMTTSFDKLSSLEATFERKEDANKDVNTKATLQTNGEIARNVDFSFTKTEKPYAITVELKSVQDEETLIDISMKRSETENEMHGKLVTKRSKIPDLTITTDFTGKRNDFNWKMRIETVEGRMYEEELTFKNEENNVDIDSKWNYMYDSEVHSGQLTISKSGGPKNFKVDVTRVIDGNEQKAEVSFKATKKIKAFAQLTNLLGDEDVRTIEFEHKGDTEKFKTTGSIKMNEDTIYSAKIDFYRYNEGKNVEIIAESTSPIDNYKYRLIDYRHEIEPGVRGNYYLYLTGDENKQINAILERQLQPNEKINFAVTTPFENYKELVYAVEVTSSMTDAKVILRDDLVWTARGTHKLDEFPMTLSYVITTPSDWAKTVNVAWTNNQPMDGSFDLTVEMGDGKKDQVHGELKAVDDFDVNVKVELNADLDESERAMEPFIFEMTRKDEGRNGKKGHLQINQYMIMDTSLTKSQDSWTDVTTIVLTIDVSTPALKEQLPFVKWHAILETQEGPQIEKGHIILTGDDETFYDLEATLEKSRGVKKLSYVFVKPRPMEYTVSMSHQDLGSDKFIKTIELYYNWNKDDADSNVKVTSVFTGKSSYGIIDRAAVFTVVRPSRTFEYDTSVYMTEGKLLSKSKIYMDKENDKKIWYDFEMNEDSHRQGKSVDGSFKLGLPSRTVLFQGSLSDDSVTKTVDYTFSWDADNIEEKKVGLTATLSGIDYKKADVTLTLPAEISVNSAVVLNQGNTIFDGKTDFFYSSDKRKTLSLYSKIKNINTYSSGFFSSQPVGFNYSMEIGVSHPESRTDVTIESQVGNGPSLATASHTVHYVTRRGQSMDMNLRAEIDKIKKEIHIMTVDNVGFCAFNSKVISETPLKIRMETVMEEGTEKTESSLDFDFDKENKWSQLTLKKDGNELQYTASFPNSTAWVAQLTRRPLALDDEIQEAQIVLKLTGPRVLHAALDWRPQAIKDAQEYLVASVEARRELVKTQLRQAADFAKKELAKKHQEVIEIIVEDTKPLRNLMKEDMEKFGTELDTARQTLEEMRDNNDFFIGDIMEVAKQRYARILERMAILSERYNEMTEALMEYVNAYLDMAKNSKARRNIKSYIDDALEFRLEQVDKISAMIVEFLNNLEEKYESIKSFEAPSYQDLYNQRQEFLQNRVNAIKSLNIPDKFSERRDMLKEKLQERLGLVKDELNDLKDRILPYVPEDMKERTTQVFEHAKSVRNFWIDEDEVRERMENFRKLLMASVRQEISMYAVAFRIDGKNPITLLDLENGKIRADIDLPVAVTRLDELPDMRYDLYVNRLQMLGQKIRPRIANTVYSAWNNNETNQPGAMIM